MLSRNSRNRNNDSSSGIATAAMPSSYFQGAPLTKVGCMFLFVSQLILTSSHQNTKKGGSEPRSSRNSGLLAGQVVMASLLLIPLSRKMERELGSIQFSLWMLATMAVSFGILYVLQLLIGGYYWQEFFVTYDANSTTSASGHSNNHYNYTLTVLMGSILYWYVKYVPRLYPRFVSICGIYMSEKALFVLWGLYVIFAGGAWSIVASSIGAFSSFAVFVVLLEYNLIHTPTWFMANDPTLDSVGNFFLLDPPTRVYAPLIMASAMNDGNNTTATTTRATTTPTAWRAETPPSPPQEAVDQLTAMGFEEFQVRQALQQSGNNVEQAADRLLSG